MRITKEAKGDIEKIILEYLEQNATDALVQKINEGERPSPAVVIISSVKPRSVSDTETARFYQTRRYSDGLSTTSRKTQSRRQKQRLPQR